MAVSRTAELKLTSSFSQKDEYSRWKNADKIALVE